MFQTIIFNPISIFMTHMSNYARDRLALVTFQVSCRGINLVLFILLTKTFPSPTLRLSSQLFSSPRHRLTPSLATPLSATPPLNHPIFTHLLIPYFQSVINFISCWTNVNLRWAPPMELAEKYFDLFPEEQSPVWQDPCADSKHRSVAV